MEIRTVEAVLFHADGQTQRTDRHTDSRSDEQTDRHDEANSRF
jgi:hypothetical protein